MDKIIIKLEEGIMRKLSIIAIAVLAVLLALTSCATGGNAAAEDGVIVSWYDGTKLLKEEVVAPGTKLTSWEA